jgi:hypothetical protein
VLRAEGEVKHEERTGIGSTYSAPVWKSPKQGGDGHHGSGLEADMGSGSHAGGLREWRRVKRAVKEGS